jgi:hypothetical protein
VSKHTTHDLKCWPRFFDAMRDGRKAFELRKNDRDYKAGDNIILREWVPAKDVGGEYTGRELFGRITYIVFPEDHESLREGYCCLAVQLLAEQP